MLQHDAQLTFINDSLTIPTNSADIGITPDRRAEYRRIMSKIDCVAIRYDPVDGNALFVAGYDDGNDWDIWFHPGLPAEVALQSGVKRERLPNEYHLLEGNWYWLSR